MDADYAPSLGGRQRKTGVWELWRAWDKIMFPVSKVSSPRTMEEGTIEGGKQNARAEWPVIQADVGQIYGHLTAWWEMDCGCNLANQNILKYGVSTIGNLDSLARLHRS